MARKKPALSASVIFRSRGIIQVIGGPATGRQTFRRQRQAGASGVVGIEIARAQHRQVDDHVAPGDLHPPR